MTSEIRPEIKRVINLLLSRGEGSIRRNALGSLLTDIRRLKSKENSLKAVGMALAAEGVLTALTEGRDLSLPVRLSEEDPGGENLLRAIAGWNLPPTSSELEEGFLFFWRKVNETFDSSHRGR